MRVLICDDEPLAVEYLCDMLRGTPDVEVVATATSGHEARVLIHALKLDLVFLDIEMPECDGFDIVESMTKNPGRGAPPLVTFVTAYRRFAPQAFEAGAIDFLMKPVRAERLEVALERARGALAGREASRRLVELQGMLEELRQNSRPVSEGPIWVPKRGEVVRVELENVDWIAAEGPYVRIYADGTSYLHRESISTMLDKIDSTGFARVHRSHLVRLVSVEAIRRTMSGGSELRLRSGESVPVGRKYARDLRRRLMEARSKS